MDLTIACEAFSFYENSKGSLSRVNKGKDGYVHTRDFHIMEPEKKIRIGSLKIEMIPVDHSLPGACGYIIYTDEGNIVYTGDIRFHGSNGDLSKMFVEKAIACKPKWMLCEGTRIDSIEKDSEEDVKEQNPR